MRFTMHRQGIRRVVLVGAVAFVCLACGDGGGDGDGASTPAAAVADLTIVPTYATPDPLGARPVELETFLVLDPDGSGVLGGKPLQGGLTVSRVHIEWSETGDSITISPNDLSFEPGARLTWESFVLALEDEDGDGVLDSGSGSVAGTWEMQVSDVVDTTDVEGAVTASPDSSVPIATFFAGDGDAEPLIPVQLVAIHFSEPLLVEAVDRELKARVNGRSFRFFPSTPNDGYTTDWAFVPRKAFPFGARLTIETGDLRDRSGRRVLWDEAPRLVIPNAGSLTSNAGFEAGASGWLGGSIVEGLFASIEPAQGGSHAVVVSGQRLVGYLNVPSNAIRLAFSSAVLAENASGIFDGVAVVSLMTLDANVEAFDAASRADDFTPCQSCSAFGYDELAPYEDHFAELLAFRGQRVFVVVEVGFGFVVGPVEVALLVDDFRVE